MAKLAAGVRKRPDGTYEKRFTVDGRRYSVYARTTKELAEKEQETRQQIKAGLYTENRNITLDGYFIEWIKARGTTAKGNTTRLYRGLYQKHIAPEMGKRKVFQIERREVLNLQRKLTEKGLSVVTVNLAVDIIKMILNDAVRDDIILKSPALMVKPLKNTENANETYHRALTVEEQKLFTGALDGEYYRELLQFLIATGVRIGEAGALTWSDIDYKAGQIHITKTMTKDENERIIVGDSTKSRAGKRDIPLTDTIKGILKDARGKWKNIIPGANSPVFISQTGGHVNSHHANYSISRVLKKLELAGTPIEHFTAHALRDTFATRYIEAGGSMQTLKTLLGHESFQMTADLYSHVLPNTKREEMDRMKVII